MRKISSFVVIALFLSVSGLLAQDPTVVAPNIYKKVFENDRVRIYEVSIKAGEKIGKHSHPAHFAYTLTDAKLKMTNSATGKSEVADLKKGQVVWFEPVTHEAENLGADSKLLVVDLKK